MARNDEKLEVTLCNNLQLQTQIHTIAHEMEEVKVARNEAMINLKECQAQINMLQLTVKNLTDEKDLVDRQRRQLQSERDQLQQELAIVDNKKSVVIDEKRRLEVRIAQLAQELEEEQTQTESTANKHKKLASTVEQLMLDLAAEKANNRKAEAIRNNIEQQNRELREKLEENEEFSKGKSRAMLGALEAKVHALEEQLDGEVREKQAIHRNNRTLEKRLRDATGLADESQRQVDVYKEQAEKTSIRVRNMKKREEEITQLKQRLRTALREKDEIKEYPGKINHLTKLQQTEDLYNKSTIQSDNNQQKVLAKSTQLTNIPENPSLFPMVITEGESTQRILRVSDIAQEPQEMLMPISGYEDMPLVPLEIAVEPLVPFLTNIQSYAYTAKQRCQEPVPDGLTADESASIMLYSMGWKPLNKCLYVVLNATLRSKDREKLQPWFLYLKLFLTAVSRLPCTRRTVFRGVKLDLHKDYPKHKTIIWWGFSSCTVSVDVLQSELFLGTTGTRTMFTIDCHSSRDISRHSYFSDEKEVLLLAATQFKVIASLDQGHGLHTVQLQEIQPSFPLLQPVTVSS